MPLASVLVVRNRTSNLSPSWPSVKLRWLPSAESVTMRAGPFCVVLAGVIQASSVMAFEF
jgi:hypothetical protein